MLTCPEVRCGAAVDYGVDTLVDSQPVAHKFSRQWLP